MGKWDKYADPVGDKWAKYAEDDTATASANAGNESLAWSDVPGKALSNLAGSAAEYGKNLVQPIRHPVDTIGGIRDIAFGGLEKIVPGAAVDGQEEKFDSVRDFFAKRYGTQEGFKKALAEDPVGVLSDLSAVLTGGGSAAARVPGIVGKAGKIAAKAGAAIEPAYAAGKAVLAIPNVVAKSKIPESLYGSTMKIPPGSVRAEDRANILHTLVRDEKLPLGSKTVEKMSGIVTELEPKIKEAVDIATNEKYATADFANVTKALDELKKQYTNRPDPEQYYKAIDRAKADIIEHDFVRRVGSSKMGGFEIDPTAPGGMRILPKETITNTGKAGLTEALDLKKGIYQEIADYYMKRQKPESGRVGIRNDAEAVAMAEAAKVLRAEVINSPSIPKEIKLDMAREAGLMNARKWVERATNRAGNLDIASLSGMLFGVMVEGGVPAATAFRVAVSQPVLSRLALKMAKHRTPVSAAKTGALFQAGRATTIPPVTLGYE